MPGSVKSTFVGSASCAKGEPTKKKWKAPKLKVKESAIWTPSVGLARKHGAICIKLSTMGRYGTNGWMDFVFFSKTWVRRKMKQVWVPRVPFFIEYKAPGEESTALQLQRQAEMRALGYTVYTDVDSVAEGMEIVRRELEIP